MNTHANNPKISFIVPVHNVEPYLVQCLSSLVSQDIDKEIIVLNDASTDNSLNAAIEFAEYYPGIQIINFTNNIGLSSVRNYGIKEARGEWLCFVDADDWLHGDYLGRMLATADEQGADIVRYQAIKVDGKEQRWLNSPFPEVHEGKIVLTDNEECLKVLTHTAWVPGVCWTLIKREFINKHQLKFLEGVQAEDHLFYAQLLCHPATVIEFPFLVYRYRVREQSITATPTPKYLQDHIIIINKVHELLEQHANDPIIGKSLLLIIFWLCNAVLKLYAKLSPNDQQALWQERDFAQQVFDNCSKILGKPNDI